MPNNKELQSQIIDGQTKIYALIAHPALHSRSPWIHNYGFSYHHLNARYVAFDATATGAAICTSIRTLGLVGCNLSLPFKESMLPYLDEVTPQAKLSKSVNTIRCDGEQLTGTNTDGDGFVRSLLMKLPHLDQKRILLLGGGATARAILVSLKEIQPTQIVAVQRQQSRNYDELIWLMKQLNLSQLSCYAWSDFSNLNLTNFDVVINATNLGFGAQQNRSPLSRQQVQQLAPGTELWDVIYDPVETQFLSFGRQSGLSTHNGYEMLLQQANLSFEFWTGLELPLKEIKKFIATKEVII